MSAQLKTRASAVDREGAGERRVARCRSSRASWGSLLAPSCGGARSVRAMVPVRVVADAEAATTMSVRLSPSGISDRGYDARGGDARSPGARMILGTSRSVRVIPPYPEPIDLRKGYDGLFRSLVRKRSTPDAIIHSAAISLPCSRQQATRRVQVLVWDGTGLCIFSKTTRALSLSRRCGARTAARCS